MERYNPRYLGVNIRNKGSTLPQQSIEYKFDFQSFIPQYFLIRPTPNEIQQPSMSKELM